MTATLIRSHKKHSREGHVVAEAENGVTYSEAKEYPESPEAGRGKKVFFPVGFTGSMALRTP